MSAHLLPISARSERSLRDLAVAYRALLLTRPDQAADVCVAAALGRDHHPHRLAAVGGDASKLAEGLAAWLEGGADGGVFAGRRPRAGISLALAVTPSGPWVEGVRRTLCAVVPSIELDPEAEGTEQALEATIAAWRLLGLDAAEVIKISAAPSGLDVLCTLGPAEAFRTLGTGAISLGCLSGEEVLLALARLYAAGVGVRWHHLWPPPAPRVDLPRYPWQRSSYWFDRSPLPGG
jgi:acyl transferase domain-containing protein